MPVFALWRFAMLVLFAVVTSVVTADRLVAQTPVRSFPAVSDQNVNMAFSPDGQSIAVANLSRVWVFDLETGELVREIQLEGLISDIAFAEGGAMVAVALGNQGAVILDAQSPGMPERERFTGLWSHIATTLDGNGVYGWGWRDFHSVQLGQEQASSFPRDSFFVSYVFNNQGEVTAALSGVKTAFPAVPILQNMINGFDLEDRASAALLYKRNATSDHLLLHYDIAEQQSLSAINIARGEEPRLMDYRVTGQGPRILLWRTRYDDDVLDLYTPGPNEAQLSLAFPKDEYNRYSDAVMSHDGHLIALHGSDGRIDVFASEDAPEDILPPLEDETDPNISLTQGHGGVIVDMDISRDGFLLATVGQDARVHLWDMGSGQQVRSVAKGMSTSHAAFSPDGQILATQGASSDVSFWDVTTGELAFEVPLQSLWIDYLGDTGALINCGTTACQIGTHEDFVARDTREYALPWVASVGSVRDADTSPDGRYAAILNDASEVWILNTQTGAEGRIALGEAAEDIAIGEDETAVVVTEAGTVFTLDIAKMEVSRRITTGIDRMRRVTAIKDGTFLLSNSKGVNLDGLDTPPTHRILDAETGEVTAIREDLAPRPGAGGAGPVIYDPVHDRVVAVAQSNWNGRPSFDIWNVDTPQRVRTIAPNALDGRALSFSKDGQVLHVDAKTVSVAWDLARGDMGQVRENTLGLESVPVSNGVIYRGVSGTRAKELFFSSRLTGERQVDWPVLEAWYAGPEADNFGNGREVVFFGTQTDGGFFAVFDTEVIGADAHGLKAQFHIAEDMIGFSYKLSPDGQTMIAYNRAELRAYSALDGTALWRKKLSIDLDAVGFSLDGQKILVQDDFPALVAAFDTPTGTRLNEIRKAMLALSDEGTAEVIEVGEGNEIFLLDNDGARTGITTARSGLSVRDAWMHSGTSRFVLSGFDGRILLWQPKSETPFYILDASPELGRSIAMSPDGDTLAILETDGLISLWRTATGERFARLAGFADGNWTVLAEDGRYDASDPGEMPLLGWVLPSAPRSVVPLELFFREFYEPSLLPRLVNGETLPDLPAIEEINRVQPGIAISAIEPSLDGQSVSVTVEIWEEKERDQQSGLGDIKLFRDGQIVGLHKLIDAPAEGRFNVTFDDILIPTYVENRQDTVFSAYTFNSAGIKSRTVRAEFSAAEAAPTKPTAYVINIGVDIYDTPSWNLTYAGADARLSAEVMADRLEATDVYDEVVTVSLLSDRKADLRLADKSRIEAVLGVLGGQTVDQTLLQDIPGADRLRRAKPDDFVYVFYAGHGYAAEDGVFHLFPQDIGGPGQPRSVDQALLSQTVTSEGLTDLFLEIQARDMVLIIDACNAAASVEGDGFKPGPMGSRGLGQLAYDKAMRIMTASQAEEVALESDLLRHGALSYAMFREGLQGELADVAPVDARVTLSELLSYGVTRVPSLYEEIVSDSFAPVQRGLISGLFVATGEPKPQTDAVQYEQRPALFDFRRNRAGDAIFLPL